MGEGKGKGSLCWEGKAGGCLQAQVAPWPRPCTTPTLPTPPSPPPPPPPQANGQCGQPWMLSGNYCRATCGFCKQDGGASAAASASASASSSSGCSDNAPPGSNGCWQQKQWGKCGEAWMAAGNYCAATCGRCSQQSGSSAQASASSSSSSSSGGSGCSDTAPPGSDGCWQQKQWGKCSEGWLLASNYCAATCGRCGQQQQQQQSGAAASSSASASSSSGCSDNAPPGSNGCWQQKQWGKCGEAWMAAGNYCAATCGRCGGGGGQQAGSSQQAVVQAFSSSSSSSHSGRRLRLK